jgi:hypothetical protein
LGIQLLKSLSKETERLLRDGGGPSCWATDWIGFLSVPV